MAWGLWREAVMANIARRVFLVAVEVCLLAAASLTLSASPMGPSSAARGFAAGDENAVPLPGESVGSSRPAPVACDKLWPDQEPARTPLAEWLERISSTEIPTPGTSPEEGALEDTISSDAEGALVGANFPISNFADSVSSTESLDQSSVAYNPGRGEYLVVWHATTRASSNNIYGRFVSAAGSPVGGQFVIADTTGIELAPSVAYDGTANQYWVAWTDLGSGSTGNVHLRRVSPTGTLLGSDIIVNSPGPVAFATRIAVGAGRCIVAWNSDPGDGNAHILVRSYDVNANPVTTVLLLSDAAGKATLPDIAFNSTDSNFLVVWYESHVSTG